MTQDKGHLKSEFGNSVADIVRNVEDAREKNDARLTLGFAFLMGCFFLPPIAPPKVVLPLMGGVLATTVLVGRKKHQQIENEFAKSYEALDATQKLKLLPLKKVLIDQKAPSLGESLDPIKNWQRVAWSTAGGFILNPMLIPAIYSGILHNNEFKKNSDLRVATHAVATKEKLELVV
jgi:hypothetical protein